MKCYKAKWILTSADEVLRDMAIVVDEGKIIDIIPNSEVNFDEKFIKDLGNAVITPGFIDLLTQYQYTDIGIVKPQSLKNKIKRFFKLFSFQFLGRFSNITSTLQVFLEEIQEVLLTVFLFPTIFEYILAVCVQKLGLYIQLFYSEKAKGYIHFLLNLLMLH